MKNYCVIHILLFLLFMIVYQCAHAQDYVVTLKGDTIRGEVKQINFGPEKKVQVTREGKRKEIYTIVQTKNFVLKGEKYEPVRMEKGYVYMKVIKSGYLALYAYQLENQFSYDGTYFYKRDGQGMELPNLTFKKSMTRFLEDCPDVVSRIESGLLSRKDVGAIVDEYNACIASNTKAHQSTTTTNTEQTKKLNAWDVLDEKVKAATFEGKADAIDMIKEIKSKISKSEKVPNFIIEGLKSAMTNSGLNAELESALAEIK